MNFSELSQIIKYLKKTFPCTHCKNNYSPKDIEVVSTFDEQGLISLSCPKCKNQILVHITISDGETSVQESGNIRELPHRTHKKIVQRKEEPHRNVNGQIISSNDVIDMHCFLGKFNGDFKKLFSEKRSR